MRKAWLAGLGILVIVGTIVALAPSPIDPLAWTPPVKPRLSGPLAPNFALRAAELLGPGLLEGPEDVDLAGGFVYCGVADGSILRLSGNLGQPDTERAANTGGRPLGIDFDSDGVLWVADSLRGLVSVDPDGSVTLRSGHVDGTPIGFADDVDVGSHGSVYFSDASTRFGPEELRLDVLEARPHGRLLEYDPVADVTRVLLDDLYFANGVAVSPDGRFVLVAETFRYRVLRYWLSGPKAGRSEIFVDNLPGFPDGISSNGEGTFWLALYGPRSGFLDRFLHPSPWLKRLVAKLPEALSGGGERYGLVVALDANGGYLTSLHDPGGGHVARVTSVEERDGHLYLGTVEGDSIARLPVP